MNKLKELFIYFKKKGFFETIKRIRSRYFSVSRFIIYRRDLHENYEGVQLGPEYNVIIDDFILLNEIRNKRNDLPREFYVDRTHGGKHFYLVLKGKDVAYIHWVLLKGDYSRFFKLQDGASAELNYNITLPAHRGNRLMAKTINFICTDLEKKGYKVLWGAASAGNILSHKSLRKTGFYEYCKVLSIFSISRKISF